MHCHCENQRTGKKKYKKNTPCFHAILNARSKILPTTIWNSKSVMGKCKFLQLITKQTKSFAPILHQIPIQFRRFPCLQLLRSCGDGTCIIMALLTWQQGKRKQPVIDWHLVMYGRLIWSPSICSPGGKVTKAKIWFWLQMIHNSCV